MKNIFIRIMLPLFLVFGIMISCQKESIVIPEDFSTKENTNRILLSDSIFHDFFLDTSLEKLLEQSNNFQFLEEQIEDISSRSIVSKEESICCQIIDRSFYVSSANGARWYNKVYEYKAMPGDIVVLYATQEDMNRNTIERKKRLAKNVSGDACSHYKLTIPFQLHDNSVFATTSIFVINKNTVCADFIVEDDICGL